MTKPYVTDAALLTNEQIVWWTDQLYVYRWWSGFGRYMREIGRWNSEQWMMHNHQTRTGACLGHRRIEVVNPFERHWNAEPALQVDRCAHLIGRIHMAGSSALQRPGVVRERPLAHKDSERPRLNET